jgi:GT2 family glycosyltransferase
MIVFGVCIGDRAKYERYAQPCLDRCVDSKTRIIELEHQSSIFVAYNAILDQAIEDPDLEAVVLVHDDLEILDADACVHLRQVFEDDGVAVVGVIGARDPQALAWWHFDRCGYVRERNITSGIVTENRGDPDDGTHPVDTVDGIFLALSPWAARNLRFDSESFDGFDGYDADICAQARAAGKRVVVTDIDVVHNRRAATVYRDFGAFRRADFTWRSKWLPASRWQRAAWRSHAALAPLEVKLRSLAPVRAVERHAKSIASTASRRRARESDRRSPE